MKKSRLIGLLAMSFLLSASALYAKAEYVIKIGTIVPESHADVVCLTKYFKEPVERESKGRIAVEIYPNAQLGGDRELAESTQLGTIQGSLPCTSALAGFDKRLQVLDLPFLFSTREYAYEGLDGDLGKKLSAILAQSGFANMGFYENGFRHVTNSRGPIDTPADLKGLKLRTMENPLQIAFFKMLGANPTPMSFGELYTALQQKTVDGQENPVALIYESKFYEVQKYLSLTGHVFSVTVFLLNARFVDSLPPDLKAIVEPHAHEFIKGIRAMVADLEGGFLEKLKAQGMVVNSITPEAHAEFIRLTAPVYDQYAPIIGKDMIDLARRYQK